MAPLFCLPREIRDMVYRHYVAVEGGYVCDTEGFVNGTLRQADGGPIDMALIFTCKVVANEMHGLALRTNSITFSTLSGDYDLWLLARRFQYLFSELNHKRERILGDAGKYMTQDAYDKLRDMYPQFVPLLDLLRTDDVYEYLSDHGISGPFGEAPSVYRDFMRASLQVAYSCDPKAFDASLGDNTTASLSKNETRTLSFLHCSVEPWAIPSPDEMAELQFAMGDRRDMRDGSRDEDGSEWRFSAASAAIYFLRCLPDTIRTHVRRLVVNEDRESIAFPESHGLGLVPFCRENPLLRVERRVDLWGNAFHADYRFHTPRERYRARYAKTETGLDSALITYNLGAWIMEAQLLASAGMPESSYSLVLDGDPVPQLCTEIFRAVVQRDVAWQLAWTESIKQGNLAGVSWFVARGGEMGRRRISYNQPRFTGCYFYEGLPEAVWDMTTGKSIVSCNFDPGEPWSAQDVDILVQKHRQWTTQTWTERWSRHKPKWWDTEHPLPSWMGLLRKNLWGRVRGIRH
ncbi:hypothetical protein LX32DRAFT_637013 [Colletotrichum zoysiae]|uniref:Uncharacterized protein n=1 Tax=Colletotrichum zoysiae TaxID=1216348 RepID=A0AAD9HM81_9PEZI|nr:hypothetical protein LX32DRAFT_637013 [Colletotrichum zoysiae]